MANKNNIHKTESSTKSNRITDIFTIIGIILVILAVITSISSLALGSSLNILHVINWILAVGFLLYAKPSKQSVDRQSAYREAVTQDYLKDKENSTEQCIEQPATHSPLQPKVSKVTILLSVLCIILVVATGYLLYQNKQSGVTIQGAQARAYDIGYEKGFQFGYSDGYADSLNGKNVNVYSEQDEPQKNATYFIVGGTKKYHNENCSYLYGQSLSSFKDADEAKAAGFAPCVRCFK